MTSVERQSRLVPRPASDGPDRKIRRAHPRLDYEREQVQPLPHRQIAPQRHPCLRVSVFFFDISSSFVRRLHVSLQTDDAEAALALHPPTVAILTSMAPSESLADESRAPLDVLLENHRVFLRYLERRVGDRDLAEDILQDAFIKVMERPAQAPADEGLVPWFYRTLRNAAIDRFRRRDAAGRAVEAFAREIETHAAPEPEMEAEICACIGRLASTLKPEYSEALQAIDVHGTPVKAFAEQRGLSASNAGVRIFRAREALKKRLVESCGTCAEHGCVNCTCRSRC